MVESLIPDEARAMIGKESDPIVGIPVSEHEIRRYCHAVDDLNPLYLNEEEAAKGSHEGIVAPALFYAIPFAKEYPLSHLREDGIPAQTAGGLTPPLKVTRTMFGGLEIEFMEPIRPGDVLTSKTKLADIYEREGRSGKMAFTILETTYTNQRGQVVAIERTTRISR